MPDFEKCIQSNSYNVMALCFKFLYHIFRQFEDELRKSDDSTDPLDVWYRYARFDLSLLASCWINAPSLSCMTNASSDITSGSRSIIRAARRRNFENCSSNVWKTAQAILATKTTNACWKFGSNTYVIIKLRLMESSIWIYCYSAHIYERIELSHAIGANFFSFKK